MFKRSLCISALLIITALVLTGCGGGGGGGSNSVTPDVQNGPGVSDTLRFRVIGIATESGAGSAQRAAGSYTIAKGVCLVTGDGIKEPIKVEGEISDSHVFVLYNVPKGKARIISCDIYSLSGEKIAYVEGLADIPTEQPEFVFDVSPVTTKAVEVFKKLKKYTQITLRWQAIVDYIRSYQSRGGKLQDVPVNEVAAAVEKCIEDGIAADAIRASDIEKEIPYPTASAPVLSYNPAGPFNFTDINSACRNVSIENTGSGILSVTTATVESWITLSPASFQLGANGSGQLQICVIVAQGQKKSGVVTLASNGGTGSIQINADIHEANNPGGGDSGDSNSGNSLYDVAPSSLDLGENQTHEVLTISYKKAACKKAGSVGSSDSATFTVACPPDKLKLEAYIDAYWITLDKYWIDLDSGSSTYVTVYVNREDLEDGPHDGKITLVSDAGYNVVIPVKMQVPFNGGPLVYKGVQVYEEFYQPEASYRWTLCCTSLVSPGAYNTGGTKQISVRIGNKGKSTVYGVTGRLSTSTNGVVVRNDKLVYGDIAAGMQNHATTNALIDVTTEFLKSGRAADFALTLADNKGRKWSLNFSVSVSDVTYVCSDHCQGQSDLICSYYDYNCE